jgi:hypothetical protein
LNPGQGGGGPTGAAGTAVTGAAGTSATGAAGTAVVSGAAGTAVVTGAAGTAAAGTSGAAGTTGAAGTGSGGRGGNAGGGGGGAAGRGTAGTTAAAGRGGAGTTGSAGRGGTTGQGGRAGSTATAGTTGAGGRGGSGMNSCPLGGMLNCTSAGSLDLTDGDVVDFSAAEWNNTTEKWCNASGLDGSLFSFAGTGSTASAEVNTTSRNLRLDLTVSAGQYAGGGVYFDSCVDARSFNSVQFTASIASGSLTGCVWQVQIQTQDQRRTTLTNPSGGTCNASTTTCERYPAATLTAATTTATMYTTRFTAFNNPAGSTTPMASQVVGLQWQVNSGNSGSGTCSVELAIDNVRFVTQ